jgi:hypothetical protein
MTVHLTRTTEIRLESLADGPGLLPYKLGSMRLTTHYHTYLQYIQLDDIESKINMISEQLRTYKMKLVNDTYLLFENQIDYLLYNLDRILNQINSLEPARAKRGLVDGIGSVIKSITGNLDQSDAIYYSTLIKKMQLNQDKIVSEFNSHISLSKDWVSHHTHVLETLVENQKKINSTLEIILNHTYNQENSLIRYANFAQLLAISSENVENLRQELIRIENCLAFIRTSTTHHSMIDINVLRKMIDKLKSIYGKNRILDLDLREYYDIIQPSFYFIEKQIVIVFQFPIISIDIFDLFRLSVVPNKNSQILIPSYPYIATHENAFVYMEAECPKYSHCYLCKKEINLQLRTTPDCIHQLITTQALLDSCQFITASLSKPAMEELDNQHYVLSFPQPTRAQLTCEREDYNLLHGSYLATVPLNCYIRTEEFTITNDNDDVKGHPLKLAMIPYDMNPTVISTHVKLKSTDLRELHSAQNKLMLETPIKLDTSPPAVIYHTTIPLYLIVIGACAITVIIMNWKYITRKSPKPRLTQKPDNPEEEHGAAITNTDGVPAIFSLDVGK